MFISTISRKDFSYLSILIFPLYTLYASFKYYDKPYAKNLFWLVCCFLGFIHIVFPEGGSSADGTRYAEVLIKLYNEPLSFDNLESNFYEEGKSVDIYQFLLTYLVSLFTDSEHVLFGTFAFVFGFFYSRNVWTVFDYIPKKSHIVIYIFILVYILLCPIWSINGVRMWTALHVFLYGALPFFLQKDKTKLFWCILSLFVHFSFIIPLIILFLWFFIPKKLHLFGGLFVFSFFLQEIDLQQINNLVTTSIPSFLLPKVNAYTNEDYAELVNLNQQQLALHVILTNNVLKYLIAFLLFYIYFLYKKFPISSLFKNLLCFTLFFYSISNFLSLIPSGGRFLTLARMFTFVCVILFYVSNQKYFSWKHFVIFKLTAFMLLFAIVFIIRTGLDYYGIQLFFSPITLLFFEDNVPIINFIKTII